MMSFLLMVRCDTVSFRCQLQLDAPGPDYCGSIAFCQVMVKLRNVFIALTALFCFFVGQRPKATWSQIEQRITARRFVRRRAILWWRVLRPWI